MSVSSVSSSSNAYNYLQGILQQQQGASGTAASSASDPISQLLDAFYPSGSASSDPLTASVGSDPTSSTSMPNFLPFSPDTLNTMISLQSQQPDQASGGSQVQSLFQQFDANGDGSISESEFENAFGSSADKTKVDGLFSALDTNGDGSISVNELQSAAQGSQAQGSQGHGHHHHHMHGAGGGEGSGSGSGQGSLADLLSSTDATGATTDTASNADGSTTTTISYADGSKVTLTTPASTGSSSSSSSGDGSSEGGTDGSTSGQNANSNNLIEQLIQLQSQMLAQSASSAGDTNMAGATTMISV